MVPKNNKDVKYILPRNYSWYIDSDYSPNGVLSQLVKKKIKKKVADYMASQKEVDNEKK